MPENLIPSPEDLGIDTGDETVETDAEEIEDVEISAEDDFDDTEIVDEASIEEMEAEDEEMKAAKLKECEEKLKAEQGLSDEAAKTAAKLQVGETVTADEKKKLAKEALPKSKLKSYAIGSAFVVGGVGFAAFKAAKFLLWEIWRHGGAKSLGSAITEGYKRGHDAAEKALGFKEQKK